MKRWFSLLGCLGLFHTIGCGGAPTSDASLDAEGRSESELRSTYWQAALPREWKAANERCTELVSDYSLDYFACPSLKLLKYAGSLDRVIAQINSRESLALTGEAISQARRDIEGRLAEQSALVEEETESEEAGARAKAVYDFYMGFFTYAAANHERAYGSDSHWAPGANSNVVLLGNEEKHQIVRIEHGDTGG